MPTFQINTIFLFFCVIYYDLIENQIDSIRIYKNLFLDSISSSALFYDVAFQNEIQ